MQGLWQWFMARSTRVKIVLGLVVLVLAIFLSPLLAPMATLAFIVSILALLYRLVRRRPVRSWGIAALASFVLILALGGVSAALYGGGSDQASAPPRANPQQAELEKAEREAEKAREEAETAKKEAAQAKEEAAQAKKEAQESQEAQESRGGASGSTGNAEPDSKLEEKPKPVADEEPVEEASKPRPKTADERLRSRIKKTFIVKKDLQSLKIQNSGAGCKNVKVGFTGEGWSAGGTVESIEYQAEEVYRAAYADPVLANKVCVVTANASGELTDEFGNVTKELLYSTTMDQATGIAINWRNSYAVDLPSMWTVNYTHPAFGQQQSVNAAEHAVDCAEDEGLFDMQPLDC